mgnify:CR=1 FL=1
MKILIKYLSITMLATLGYSECNDYNEFNCNNDNSCEWIENLDVENCYEILDCTGGCTWQDCEAIEGCNWHFGTAYYDPSYCYGEHEVDNGYCQEIEIVECVDLDQNQCNHPYYGENCEWIESETDCNSIELESSCNDNDCNWVEDIDYGNCSNYNNSWSCDSNPNCFWDLCYGGSYGSWSACCRGGSFEIDNSYCNGESGTCEDSSDVGDINGDGSINIQDIIIAVSLILTNEYNYLGDVNGDGILNVLDIVSVVATILDT